MVGAREKVVGILATTPVNRLHFPMTNVVIHKEISVCTWMFAACAYYWWWRLLRQFFRTQFRNYPACLTNMRGSITTGSFQSHPHISQENSGSIW